MGMKAQYFILCLFSILPLLSQESPEAPEVLPQIPVEELYRHKTKTGQGFRFPGATKIWVGGDVMFNWGVRDSIKPEDPEYAFRSFQALFAGMDMNLVNLETPILKKKPSADKIKSYVFYGEEEHLALLKSLGVQGVFLGNNHTMDFGTHGLEETTKLLEEKGIAYAGAGKNRREALRPILFKKSWMEFLFFSASEIGELRLFAGESTPGVMALDKTLLVDEMKKKSTGKVPILSLHWGVEYSPDPTEAQRRLAKELIQSGYKVIVGHHPHVPQGIEVFPGGAVIYSLGNFFFGSKNSYLKHNVSVVLHFQEKKLLAIEVIPVFGKHQEVVGDAYFEPLDPESSEEFLKEYAFQCEKLGTKLVISGGRGYVFLEKERKEKDKKN